MINSFLNFKYPFSVILIFLILLPNSSSNLLNGLPVSTVIETILIVIVLPIFFFFEKYKKFKNLFLLIGVFFVILKFINHIYLPGSGISHKFQRGTYETSSFTNLNDNFIKTFDTVWHNKFSSIQNRNWENIWDFPIDWTYRHKNNIKNDNEKFFNNYNEFLNQEFFFQSYFVIPFFEDVNFLLKTGNYKFSKIIIQEIQSNKKKLIQANEEIELKKGIYTFESKILFTGSDWKFEPKIKNSNDSLFFKNTIFQDHNIYKNIDSYKIISFYILIFDYLLILFLILILFQVILNTNTYYLKLSFSFFILTLINYFLIHYILSYIGTEDVTNIFFIGISIIMFGFFHVYFILNTKNYNYIFISIIPTIILYFLFYNFKNIDTFQWWSINDDWEIFRVFAREIVVDNIWVNQSEAEYRYRPGIRYFFALNHYLFSKSSFADALLEIYAILFASFLLFKSFKNFEIDERVAFSISLILLFIFFSTNHRWLIGRGLTEYYALFNIMFLLYLISKIEKFTYYKIIGLAILGGIGVWLREDHLPLILSLILLKDFKYISTYNFKTFFYSVFESKKLFFYLIVIFIFFLLLIKNKIYLDTWGILNQEVFYNKEIYGNPFYRMFFSVEDGERPSITSVFIIVGVLISLLYVMQCIISNTKLERLLFFVTIFAILLPFFFVNNAAYAPRYTIIFLPFCLFPIAFFVNRVKKTYFS